MNKRTLFPFGLLLFSLFFILPSVSYAVFNLTVLPSQGGFDLRFQRLAPGDFKQTKEVTLTVTSDIGKQYRILQKVTTPLATADGTEIPASQFKVYPLINSNSRGTLLYQEEVPVSEFNNVFYTSDGTGSSDSLKLVYTIAPSPNQVPGSYYGRLAYILTPIDSTQSQVVVNINVYAEFSGSGVPVVQVSTSTSSKRLTLTSKGMGPKESQTYREPLQVSFKIPAPVGSVYRIYQSLENGSLVSGAGDEFDPSKVLFSVTGAEKGTPGQEGDLKSASTKALLYVSDPGGGTDEFTVVYAPAKDFRLQKAGLYRGRLNFIIETDKGVSGPQVLQSLDVEIEIVPLFDIYVYSGGEEGVTLKFGQVSYKTGPKTSVSEVYIESNMGTPYQVVQKVSGPMMDEAGNKVPAEDFTAQVKEVQGEEEPGPYLKDAAPVKEGETMIFASGLKGSSAHFKVEYTLKMRPDSKAGNYTTRISYGLALN